jgi:hypothetical protein
LLDGSVEVTGGFSAASLRSTEIYDPATGQWQMNGSLNLPVARHVAALLQDGEVLVAGGFYQNRIRAKTSSVSQLGPP